MRYVSCEKQANGSLYTVMNVEPRKILLCPHRCSCCSNRVAIVFQKVVSITLLASQQLNPKGYPCNQECVPNSITIIEALFGCFDAVRLFHQFFCPLFEDRLTMFLILPTDIGVALLIWLLNWHFLILNLIVFCGPLIMSVTRRSVPLPQSRKSRE